MKEKYAGQDCPTCESKGTLFRCPRRSGDVICYVCLACSLKRSGALDDSRKCSDEGCVTGVTFSKTISTRGGGTKEWVPRGNGGCTPEVFWENTPEMSFDLYDLVFKLWVQYWDLKGIRTLINHEPEEWEKII